VEGVLQAVAVACAGNQQQVLVRFLSSVFQETSPLNRPLGPEESLHRRAEAMPRISYAHKREYSTDQRKTESARVRERYNDRVPVICEKMPESDVPTVDKSKYLIPMDMTVGQLVYVLRKRISLPSDKAIFVFVNNTLPPSGALMSNIYLKHKDEDGFLYICYSGENSFG